MQAETQNEAQNNNVIFEPEIYRQNQQFDDAMETSESNQTASGFQGNQHGG